MNIGDQFAKGRHLGDVSDGGYAGCAAAKAPDAPEMQRQFDWAEQAVAELRARLELLRERIDPVMCPAIPVGDSAKQGQIEKSKSKHSERIEGMRGQINQLSSLVDEMIGRIEV